MLSAPSRRIALALLLALTALLAACAGQPPRGTPEASSAFTDTRSTALARIAAASRPATASARSGFRLLPTGEFALDARIALSRRAERSLDLQCYHIARDPTGLSLLRELRDAAARGVRVRLLVDDLHAADVQDLLADLAAHASVQVRLFNPLPLRWGSPLVRLLLSPGEFERYNHRMHNKLFLADNAVAIYGGRNVADEYFMNSREANFIDLDLLSTGAVVRDLSDVFDRYWNSEAAWPVQAVLAATADAAAARAHFDAAVRDATPLMPDYGTDPLGDTAVSAQLQAGRLSLQFAEAQVFADPPSKAAQTLPADEPTAAMAGMLSVMAGAREAVVIVSPYFLPGPVGMPMMRKAAHGGVRTVLFTNSLGSTDEPLVHDHYSKYRVEMLQIGVQIHEFSPQLTRRSRGFGAFGRSTPRLHAKVAVIDRRQVLVGSVNLDGRSAVANTEMSVVIDSAALAGGLGRLLASGGLSSMYRLALQADGRTIEWISADPAEPPTTEEPEADPWLRFTLWLQSLLVDERLL